jgi:ribonuclease P protein component
MLAKQHRLTKREDFAAVYSKGAYSNFENITIKYSASKSPLTRIGFSIGKTFSKKSRAKKSNAKSLARSLS